MFNELDIRANNADDQILAREIVTRCIPSNVFRDVYVNACNAGRWYAIAYSGMFQYQIFGINAEKGILTI